MQRNFPTYVCSARCIIFFSFVVRSVFLSLLSDRIHEDFYDRHVISISFLIFFIL